MQCPNCQFENPESARFCVDCGTGLDRACPACGEPVGPGQKFCAGCGAALADARSPGRAAQRSPESYIPSHLAERILSARGTLVGERKRVTVLFADVVDSTALTREMDPEQAAKLLEPALGAMIDAVHRYEGTVNKLQGDGVMALFGAPLAHEDHAVRACYAALAMQRAIAAQASETRGSYGAEVQVRVGLNSGEVLVRAVGNDLGMDYDAIGPTVHLASRMEQIATAGGTRLTADTLRLVEGLVDVRSLGPVPVKGIAEPIEVYDLIGASAARTRLQAAAARGLTRFVGRQDEMETLYRGLGQAGEGHGQIIAAIGEPGVGKSRLYYEFIRSHRTDGWLVLESSSVSYGKATAWAPVTDLLRAYFRIETGDDDRTIREKVTGKILTLDEALNPVIPAILSLFEAADNDADWQALEPIRRRRMTLDAVKALLLRESEVQPLIVVFEDLHWADGESLALLDGLIESLPAVRILLLVNFRPEFTHDWAGRAHYAQVRLNPLAEQGADELLAALLGTDEALTSLRQSLIERAEGNPLFLEESVRTLVETGVLDGEPGAYAVVGDPVAVEMPATVQAIIAARIDRLAPEDKRLLQTTAVIGHDVALALLRSVAGLAEDDLQRGLATLQSAEFLYEARLFPDLEYSFKHAFTNEVAYSGLLESQRRELHAQVGETIERLYPDRHVEMAEQLANHFARGEVWGKAADYHLRAAAKAGERYSYANAIESCRGAVDCAERASGLDDEQRCGLVMLGDLWSLMDDLHQANDCYDRALALAVDAASRTWIENKRHRQSFAVRDGARIAYYEHGSGDETIVFATPLGYGIAGFQPIVERLCQEFRTVSIEARGVGASDPIVVPYGIDQQTEDIRAVIDALDAGPVTAVGWSATGSILYNLVHTHPELVKKLVTIGTNTRMEANWGAELLEHLDRGDVESFIEYAADTVFTEPGSEDLRDLLVQSLRQIQHDVLWVFLSSGGGDYSLEEITVPTLIMHGTEDRNVPFEEGRVNADRIPGALLYPFEGMGHGPMFTATAEFCDVLRQFIRTGTVPEPRKRQS